MREGEGKRERKREGEGGRERGMEGGRERGRDEEVLEGILEASSSASTQRFISIID